MGVMTGFRLRNVAIDLCDDFLRNHWFTGMVIHAGGDAGVDIGLLGVGS